VFARRYRQPFAGVLVSQVVERLLDVASVLVLYLVGVFVLQEVPAAMRASGWAALVLTAVAAVIAWFLLKNGDVMLSVWERLTASVRGSVQQRGRAILADIILTLSPIRNSRHLAFLFSNSLAQWLCMAGIIWSSLHAFGASAPFAVSLIVLAAVILAVSIPGAPGYIGSIQVAFLIALSPFGIDENTAFAASVFFLAVPWIVVTFVGVCCFVFWDLRLADVRRDVERVEERCQ